MYNKYINRLVEKCFINEINELKDMINYYKDRIINSNDKKMKSCLVDEILILNSRYDRLVNDYNNFKLGVSNYNSIEWLYILN